MALLGQSPGTVSQILWHFTGGPSWNDKERRQNRSPKPAAEAYRKLRSILEARELRLGSYREVVRVRTTRRTYNRAKRRVEVQENVQRELVSAPVCCLADVPVIHLSYLARRYGRFAIGFHREAVVRHGFNPVFYALEDAASIKSIYRGFSQLRKNNAEMVRAGCEIAQEEINEYIQEQNLEGVPEDGGLELLLKTADEIDNWAAKVQESFGNFLALVKTFIPDEFGTIYCEREWRALSPFVFDSKDVAMVVVPRRVGKYEYFNPFIRGLSGASLLPRSVPVVPWEDLVEH